MSLQAVSFNSLKLNEDTTACRCKAPNSTAYSQVLPVMLAYIFKFYSLNRVCNKIYKHFEMWLEKGHIFVFVFV